MESDAEKLAIAIHHLHNAVEVIARQTGVNVEKLLEESDRITAEIVARHRDAVGGCLMSAVLAAAAKAQLIEDRRRWAVVRDGVGCLRNIESGVARWGVPSEAVLFHDEANAQAVADLLGNAFTTIVVEHE